MNSIVEKGKSLFQGIEGEGFKSISDSMIKPTTTVDKEERLLLESLDLDSKTIPVETTTTLFPPLPKLPGGSLDVDTVNQKLTKIQSSIDDGFAEVITKLNSLTLSKQSGGRRTRKKRTRRSKQKKRN